MKKKQNKLKKRILSKNNNLNDNYHLNINKIRNLRLNKEKINKILKKK